MTIEQFVSSLNSEQLEALFDCLSGDNLQELLDLTIEKMEERDIY